MNSKVRFSQPVSDLIRQRYSVRSYCDQPLPAGQQQALAQYLASLPPGPFAAPGRFELVTATSQDRRELRGLGTYGFIRNSPGFIIGTVDRAADKNLEDFGYRMEEIVLFTTALGLGTCWLGGFFTRSSFGRKISLRKEEVIPAVCAVGETAEWPTNFLGTFKPHTGQRPRRPWEDLFFDCEFGRPLTLAAAGGFADALEMVRIGPSASNQQPWRIVRDENRWHFYLKRNFGKRQSLFVLLQGEVDIQRVDLGIAMCHFELVAAEASLGGKWRVSDPGLKKPDPLTEYVVTWEAAI